LKPRAGTLVLCAILCLCLSPGVRAQQKPADSQAAKEQKPPAVDQNGAGAQSGAATAPQDPKSAAAPSGAACAAPAAPSAPPAQSGTSNERLLFALPNYLTVEGTSHLPPLTAGEKFKLVARGMFDPAEFVWVGLIAGIGQASDSEPSYGQGAAGYGRRYGTTFGDTLIENFMVGAVLPSLLRQDPRYYRMGKGGFFHRAGYAAGRIFATRSDSGGKQFNYSEIFGSAMAAGISTYSYHPQSDRNLGNAASVWGTQIASDVASAMLKEFWPDLRKKAHKKQAT